jgi:hypothetical protein
MISLVLMSSMSIIGDIRIIFPLDIIELSRLKLDKVIFSISLRFINPVQIFSMVMLSILISFIF